MSPQRQSLTLDWHHNVIEHLGVKSYNSLPAVLSEMVANSWDADANEVEIKLPIRNSTLEDKITILDDGKGMNFNDFKEKYLVVGRDKREFEGEESEEGRKLMGRKGIGKLAAFGIAEEIIVKSWKNTMDESVRIRLNLAEIRDASSDDYEVPWENVEINSDYSSGTLVILNNIDRERYYLSYIRKAIARRFSVISENFKVKIQDEYIDPTDRGLEDLGFAFKDEYEEFLDDENRFKVEGWIGGTETTPPDNVESGVAILAHGKLAHEPEFFGAESTKHGIAPYIIGEIHADFVDEELDLISTNRRELSDSQRFRIKLLKDWLTEKISSAINKRDEYKKEEREREVLNQPEVREWYDNLEQHQGLARKLIRAISTVDDIDHQMTLFEYIKNAFGYEAFREMIQERLNQESVNLTEIIEIMGEWEFVEAAETKKVWEGRLKAMEMLRRYEEDNALEREAENLIVKNPWLVIPDYIALERQKYYSQILRDHLEEELTEEQSNRILDIFAVKGGGDYIIIELKRPGNSVSNDAIDQALDYKEFLNNQIRRMDTNANVNVIIIGSNFTRSFDNRLDSINEGVTIIEAKKYSNLIQMAQDLHSDFIESGYTESIEDMETDELREDLGIQSSDD